MPPPVPKVRLHPEIEYERKAAAAVGKPSVGRFGSFRYGDRPAPGTQQHADIDAYFDAGGNDPQNLYVPRRAEPLIARKS